MSKTSDFLALLRAIWQAIGETGQRVRAIRAKERRAEQRALERARLRVLAQAIAATPAPPNYTREEITAEEATALVASGRVHASEELRKKAGL